MRLRIAWGGGAERQWQATIRVAGGELRDPQALGVEADEPGSFWIENGELRMRCRSPRAYDGVDVTISGDVTARLSVTLQSANAPGDATPVDVPLTELVNGSFAALLDKHGNRMQVTRTPGDKLRVKLDRDALVFGQGEKFSLEVQPHLLGLPTGSSVRLGAHLTSVDGAKLWSQDVDATSTEADGAGKPAKIEFKLPEAEGVYDLTITTAGPWQQRLMWKKPVAERRVQLVVVASERPQHSVAAFAPVAEIDPVNPNWWERLGAGALLPGQRKGPLGNGDAKRWDHPQLGPFIQLGNSASGQVSWEAYPLSIAQPGQPHIVEVEYPGDLPQTLGLSVVEPNAAGAVAPIGLDSGVYVTGDANEDPPQTLKHRLVFWPRAKDPVLLVTNRRPGGRALYRRITVLAAPAGKFGRLGGGEGPKQLPPAFAEPPRGDRLLAGYYERPLIAENFSASDMLDPQSRRSLDDWTTFHQATTRLADYLHYVGYNGLMLSVAADGSGLYPSQRLEPTPRHDTGAFCTSGQDPVRKDVLELALRVFDREGLRLIPAVSFTGPLAELEALRRIEEEADGLDWITADGGSYAYRHLGRTDGTPTYNPLDPRVQEAMLRVLSELAERYRKHDSFGGLAVVLSADGYAQLPSIDGGYDDDTIERYTHDTHIEVAGEGPGRFAARAQFLNGAGKAAWLTWRANQLALFHRRMQKVIGDAKSADAKTANKLYLVASTLMEHPQIKRSLHPALPRRAKVEEALLGLGLRPEAYQNDDQIVLVRPNAIAPPGSAGAWSTEIENDSAAELDRLFVASRRSASLCYHEPERTRLASFDAKSPFGAANTFTSLVAEYSPSGSLNRRHFVHSVAALDAAEIFDGGWMLPLGQEAALNDLRQVYRQLPAARFDTLEGECQPVTIRTHGKDNQTVIYLANDSPWPVTVTLSVMASADVKLEKLGAGVGIGPLVRAAEKTTWTVNLQPYDLVGARFIARLVQFRDPKVSLPQPLTANLEQKIRDLGSRAAALAAPAPLESLENPSFESPAENDAVPGWKLSGAKGVTIALDPNKPHTGGNSLLLKSDGPAAHLTSLPLVAPATGRVAVALWMRVANKDRQPSLRLALEANADGIEYYRYAPLGATATALSDEWAQYLFQVDDLPTENVSNLRVRLDLSGAGEVNLDDVQVYPLAFAEHERVELAKLITLASYKLQAGQVADCSRILNGYWPQFLLAHVPATAKSNVAQRTKPSAPPAEPAKKPGRMDQLRGYLPKWPTF